MNGVLLKTKYGMKWTKQVGDGIFDRWVVRARRGDLLTRDTEPVQVPNTSKPQELP